MSEFPADQKSFEEAMADRAPRSPAFDGHKHQEALRLETLKAWEAFLSTGHHVTAVKADAWLAQLEQGNDVDPPEGQPATGTSSA